MFWQGLQAGKRGDILTFYNLYGMPFFYGQWFYDKVFVKQVTFGFFNLRVIP